ncbi:MULTISPECIES: ATP-binding protein [Streptomyces]|uniref:ATP-binding protein n=1 Tax=Streptomyces xinghaiensis TaxID=1038928 RepID=A0A3M8F862_9ACTN|nr:MULTISPECIES: ATP-binding protein [Streptomyces]PQM23024.1 ATP-binding protein [Streptomyces xinghaiensis]RKM97508.1 ATP-binding protein [Streptomyces xinghaiensis]RNC74056.1 ATP-binding protein [Streptomyces xinghaiensis]
MDPADPAYRPDPADPADRAGLRGGRAPGPAAALATRLARLREHAAALVELRSAGDPTADDPLRGLYLSPDAIRHALRTAGGTPPTGEDGGTGADAHDDVGGGPGGDLGGDGEQPPGAPAHPGDRLPRLAARFGLALLDVRILLAALAPDVDRTFEPLYGYLNDDVGRRRATTGLVLDLCGLPADSAAARARLHPSAPLRASGLLLVEEDERPFLSRSLRVPDRVTAHLLGDDTPDAALAGHARLLPAADAAGTATGARGGGAGGPDPFTDRLATRLAAGPLLVHLREHRPGDGLSCALAALRAAGREALLLTPPPAGGTAHAEGHDHTEHAAAHPSVRSAHPPPLTALLREARLRDCAVVVSPLPDGEAAAPLVRGLSVDDVPVLLTGAQPYDPQWSGEHTAPLALDAPRRTAGATAVWAEALGLDESTGNGGDGSDGGLDLARVTAAYRLGDEQVRRAAGAAHGLAAFDGTPLTAAHLRLAARQQSASGLERHARRIRPAVDWDDLVLPETPLEQLRELALRSRFRDRVLGEWRLSAGGGRGRGVLGLFAGESGTGKTLSAEVVAAELGLDLYVVQLSSVVDKYVGETEKNLERIFTEADRTDAVLLFDEADAVFGKRSEVKDSHDRYANMESAYLLQRLESFDGIALLTTNLRANIDEAFTRRLDLVIDFPFPDAEQRLALWHNSLAAVPCEEGLDARPCAQEFELSGGAIRSAVVTAAYAAAARGGAVGPEDLLAGARREYRKAGRLVPPAGRGW